MGSGNKKKRVNVVYSTNPDYNYEESFDEDLETLAPEDQDLRVWIDRKHRKGKTATLVKGFVGAEDDLKELAKILKSKCGTGGAAKDGEIIIQGDFREKILQHLSDLGYSAKKAGG